MATDIQTNKDQGFALVVVLLVLLLVTTLAAEVVFTVRTGVQEGRQAKQNSINRGLAKAGINLALFHLVDKPLEFTEDDVYIPGCKKTVFMSSGRVDILLQSESGKIDLNNINRPLLSQFLEQYGYEPSEQEILIDSMQDWVDNDDLHRLNGAESDYYATLTPPYKPANSAFTDPSELFLVRGAEKLMGKINPSDFFTIYNPTGRINFNNLNERMLYCMASGDDERVQQYYEIKSEGLLLGAIHAQLILDEDYAMWQPYLVYSKGKNQYYTAIATGFAGVKDPITSDIDVESVEMFSGCRIRLLLRLSGSVFRYIRWSEESIVE